MMSRKAAFITGGGHGMGRGIATVLANNGYDIAVTYCTDHKEAQTLQQEIEKAGGRCFCYRASLDQAEVPEAVTQRAISDLGRMDLMVCAESISVHQGILTSDQEQMDSVYRLNYRSYLLCAKAAANHMVDSGIAGSIIFITSTHALRAYKRDWLYGSLLSALHRTSESLAMQLAPYGIRVNCIAPGAIGVMEAPSPAEPKAGLGAKIPLGRCGASEDIAYAIEYLASDKASYITGVTLKVDGGLILPGMPESESSNGWDPH